MKNYEFDVKLSSRQNQNQKPKKFKMNPFVEQPSKAKKNERRFDKRAIIIEYDVSTY